jgi:hypothetical protein
MYSLLRNVETSIYHYIASGVQAIWSGVKVLDAHPPIFENLTVPSVACDFSDLERNSYEIGSDKLEDKLIVQFYVYARADGERDDVGYYITELLVPQCDIYDYSTGTQGARLGFIDFDMITFDNNSFFGSDIPASLSHSGVVTTECTANITT